ncbi:MAG: MFS transporter [Tepidibacillus sp.]
METATSVQTKRLLASNRVPLLIISLGHMLNDLMTSVLPALISILIIEFDLSYTQSGLIIMVANVTSSLVQPVFGYLSDRKPLLWLLPLGVFFTGLGLSGIAVAPSYAWLLFFVGLSGLGSAAFHPEASRGAHLAAGKGKGLAQSIFQVGGNGGQALGPLMIPLFLSTMGVKGTPFFLIPAVLAAYLLWILRPWMKEKRISQQRSVKEIKGKDQPLFLLLLVFVVTMRSWITIGVTTFLPLYYINVSKMTIDQASVYTFIFLLFGALGTLAGGPIADYLGKKTVVNASLLLAIPFLFLLPYVEGIIAMVVVGFLGFILFSSFAVTVVFGQELIPGKVGMASGLMIGFAIGAAGIGATALGYFVDHAASSESGLTFVLKLLSWILVASGLISLTLPNDKKMANQ